MLLATKLFTPQPHRQMVTRPLVTSHQQRTLRASDPHLCAGWLRQDDANCRLARPAAGRRQSVWLALDEQDNDPVRFLTYLLAAFQRVEATLGAGLRHVTNGAAALS
ncbi:MAG: hypothetical protein R3E79_00600 [Caldilineaceae bacterium]